MSIVSAAVIASAAKSRKPVLSCWMGASLVEEGRERFAKAGIPHFLSPEAGVEAFHHLARFLRLVVCWGGGNKYHLRRQTLPFIEAQRPVIQC